MMRRLSGDEEGAVAVLYSIVIMLLLGMLAVVIDLGALRADRRQTQTVADLAAVAGASELMPDAGVAGSPRAACVTAFAYVLENLVDAPDEPDTSFCNVLPATIDQPCESYADPIVATTDQLDPYFIAIGWPVPDDHEWMTNRHAYDEDVDGDNQCDRIAVQVSRTRGFVFGGVLAQVQGSASSPAVARATVETGTELVAALVVLDPFACNTLLESGGGSSGAIHVFESYKTVEGPDGPDVEVGPGIVAVDSDASAAGSGTYGCSNKHVIELNGTNTQIYAGVVDDDGDGRADLDGSGRPVVRDGTLFSYAIKAGRQAKAYNPNHVTGSQLAGGDAAPPLPGDPPVGGDRVTREPWLWRYDCMDTYDVVGGDHVGVDPCPGDEEEGVDPGSEYVTALRRLIATATRLDEDGDPATTDDVFYEDTTGDRYRVVHQGAGNRCDLSAYQTDPGVFIFDTGSNWWFDCNLDIQSNNRMIIPDGNVVVQGNVNLQGALAVNTTSAGPDTEGEDNWMYVSGAWSKSGGAALRLGNPSDDPDAEEGGTFVLLGGGPSTSPGRIQMTGGSSSGSTYNIEGTSCNTEWNDPGLRWSPCHFTWIAPYGNEFEDLGLWSEYRNITNSPHTIGGDLSNLITDGIFYMPNAKFDFGGSGEMGQQRAQFISYRLHAAGNGALKIRPDPERSRGIKFVVPELIR